MNQSHFLPRNFNKIQCLRAVPQIYAQKNVFQMKNFRTCTNNFNDKKRFGNQFNFIRYSQTLQLKCWNCNTTISSAAVLTCDKCRVIQHPRNKNNYFKVFDLNENFNIDQKRLTAKYRQLQTVLHPDKFVNKSEVEKDISAEYSSLVNKAYNTLQTPLGRAIHMLKLHNVTINDELKSADPEFLMEIMELNEEIEEANTPDKLRELNVKNQSVLEEIGKEISNFFTEDKIENAKDAVIKMKYYNSIKSHIDKLMRERGIVD